MIAGLLALLLSGAAGAAPGAARMAATAYTLANGLTVVVNEDHSAPVVAVDVWYNVGSRDEQPGKTGFAHLFEHYMFEGSAHDPSGRWISRVQAMGGEVNADTTQDRTNYYEVVPKEALEETLRLEADRMRFLTINARALDKERAIVKNEKRLRENEPYSAVWDAPTSAAFGAGHPYATPVLGSMRDLDAASVSDVKRFHDAYYVPGNAVLVISGDVEPAAALAAANKWFGTLSRARRPHRAELPARPADDGFGRTSVEDPQIREPMLLVAYRVPGEGQPGWLALRLAAKILQARMQSGPTDLGDFGAGLGGLKGEDVFVVRATVPPGGDLKATERAIRLIMDDFLRGEPRPEELRRAQAKFRLDTLDALQHASSYAAALAEAQAVRGSADVLSEVDGSAQLTADDVAAAARRYLRPEAAKIVTIVPKAP